MRVYELAKEYEYKATAFLDIIQEFGIQVNSHMSGLDEHQVKDIRFKMDMVDHTKEGKSPLREEIVNERNVDFLERLQVVGKSEEEQDEIFDKDPEAFEEYCDDNNSHETENKGQEETIVTEDEYEIEQKVIIEKPRGFWGWITNLFQ